RGAPPPEPGGAERVGAPRHAARSVTRVAFAPPAAAMLTHFTRASGDGGGALDNLVAILRAGVIRGAVRMVRGKQATVCLCDAPLGELNELLRRSNRRRYEPFGIALDKRYAFAAGARPVIYLPWAEAEQLLDDTQMWRVVPLELSNDSLVDWTFEREWRHLGDLTFPAHRSVALVETWRDADEIYDRFDGSPPCLGVLPLRDLFGRS
ncbi:MAG: hypothetical protein ACREQX_13545, partial [Candidatus Binataceae bacterium]